MLDRLTPLVDFNPCLLLKSQAIKKTTRLTGFVRSVSRTGLGMNRSRFGPFCWLDLDLH